MAEQCGYLAIVAERSGVALHVLPDGVNMGVWGAFDIATRDSTATVRLSTFEDMTSTAPDMVDKLAVEPVWPVPLSSACGIITL